LVGAFLMLAGVTGISVTKGNDWILPIGILLVGVFFILVFSFLTFSNEYSGGSTPIKSEKGMGAKNIEQDADDLPDPLDSGIELPIL